MKWTHLKAMLCIIPLSLILLVFPVLVRFSAFNGIMPGYDPYYYALYNGVNPFSFLSSFVNPFVISSVFAFLSVIVFYSLMIRFNKSVKFSLLSTLLFSVSPALLYCAIFPGPYSMLLFLALSSIFFLSSDDNVVRFFFIPFLFLASLFGAVETFVVAVCLVAFLFYDRRLTAWIIPSVISMVLISLVKSFTVPGAYHSASLSFILTDVITDLGSYLGFGFFSILLCVIGLSVAGKHKIKFYSAYVCFAVLSLTALFFARWAFVFVNLFVVVISAFAFYSLMSRKYYFDLIKTFTLLAIVCGIMFSSISYIHRMSFSEPNPDVVDSLLWLKKNSANESVVLSHYSYGFWISYYAERKPFSDGNNKMASISNDLFSGRNLKSTSDLLNQNNIKYVLITDKMRHGLVWDREDDGLLFLIHQSDSFRLVHSSNSTEIWEFKG